MNGDEVGVGFKSSLYGLNGSLSSTRRSNSSLDKLEVTRHRSGVETKAVARGEFEENLTDSDRPNVIVRGIITY